MINAGTDTWTDERIESTVTTHFIYSHLGEAAHQQISGSEETLAPTYAQRVAKKAKRLFLTLIDIGLPHQIFRLTDEYYDDDYLPFAEDEVASLRLSRDGSSSLDELFYRQQYKYLVRVVNEGEHIRYGQVEYVPAQHIEPKVANSLGNAFEKVKLPSPVNRILVRRQYPLHDHEAEVDILSEIAAVKPLSHQHVLSIYGSYTQHEQLYILLAPATKYNLKAFLNDVPKAFELLAKHDRRICYLMWPHCLSTALAWLHLQGAHHGAVRPSRVLLDDRFQVSLGHFEGDDWLLATPSAREDLEKYQYGAPEFWKRALTIQSHGTSKAVLSSGGRTQHPQRADEARPGSDDASSGRSETVRLNSLESSYAFVPAFKDNSSRLQLKMANEIPTDLMYVRNTESRRGNRADASLTAERPTRTLSRRLDAFSKRSSMSSEIARRAEAAPSKFNYAMPAETKKAVVQSWKSAAHDMQAADIFGLAAVTTDILTVLCSRSISSYAKHRAAKNRQAGRGGGLADASFHANLSQVVSWAETLHKEAEKKVKKDSGKIFQLVGPFLEEILPCFDKEVRKRPRAERLSENLQRHLSGFAGVGVCHCTLKIPSDSAVPGQKPKHRAESHLHNQAPQQSLAEDGAKYGRSSNLTHKPDLRSIQKSPKDSYEHNHIVTTPSLAVSPPTAREAVSGRQRRSSEHRDEEDYSISPELYDYYEDQWTIPQQGQTFPARTSHGRLHKDFTLDEHRYYRDFTQDDWESSPVTANHYAGLANKRSAASEAYYQSPRTYSTSENKPPDRELPAIPYVANIAQRRGGRKPLASDPTDVAQATRMLAQTLGNLNQR